MTTPLSALGGEGCPKHKGGVVGIKTQKPQHIVLLSYKTTILVMQNFKNNLSYYFQAGDVYSDGIRDMAVDAQGNIYIVGYFAGSVDFDPGPGTNVLTNQQTNAFVQKLDTNYNLLWVRSFGHTQNGLSAAENLALDDSGNVYVSGFFQGDIRFQPSGTLWTTGSTNINSTRQFVVKLNSNGNIEWGYGWSSTNSSIFSYDIVLDNSDDLYVVGTFDGTIDFDPRPNSTIIASSNGSFDAYLLKMRSNGNIVQVETFGDSAQDIAYSVNELNDDLVISGHFGGLVDVDFSSTLFYLNSNGDLDAFVLKVDTGLNFINAVSFGGSGLDQIQKTIITSTGNIVNYGQFRFTVDFDPGAGNTSLTSSNNLFESFIQVLDFNGGFKWAKKIEATQVSQPLDIVEKDGKLLLTGTFDGTCDLNPDPNVSFNVNQSQLFHDDDAYVALLDTAGNFIAGAAFGSVKINYLYAAEISTSNKYLIGGVIRDTMDVDPTSGVNYLISNGTQYGDILFMELGTCTLQPEDTAHIVACQSYMLPDSQVTTTSTYYSGLTISSTGCDSNYVLDVVIKNPADFNLSATRVDTTLIASAQGTNLTYQWIDCGANQPIPGATDSVFVVSVNGSYAVIVSDSICTDTSTCITVNDISIAEDVLATGLSVYPNPTNGQVVLESLLYINHIYVLDMAGRMVLSAPDPGKEIDLSILQPGVYMLKAATTRGVAVERVVKR
jgi:hypothetical protein